MRLQRYILGLLVRNFLLVLLVITGLVFLVSMGQNIGQLKGGMSLVLTRIPYFLPRALSIGIPLSMMVGVLLTYGRLSADNEILAVRMGGIHPFHALSPAIVMGLVLAMIALWVNGTLGPEGEARGTLITKDDLRRLLSIVEQRRVREFTSDNLKLTWQEADEDGSLLDVDFEIMPADGVLMKGKATRAGISMDAGAEELQFAFDHVLWTVGDGKDKHEAERESFRYPISSLFQEPGLSHRSNQTSEELLYRALRAPHLGHPGGTSLTLNRVEYYARIGFSLACIVFVLVGAPVGILFRRGSFIASSLVALVTAFLVYWPLHEFGKYLAEFQGVPPALAMSSPTVVLTVAGLVLLSRVLSR